METNNLIGQVLKGRYRIDELLGEGGMATVYKAYDPNLRRAVAVKVIHPDLVDDTSFLARFEAEATAVARLRHPNIVEVFDFDHDGDVYYMVQAYVPGETLQDRLRRLEQAGRSMPLEEAVRYAVQLCAAAGYAHSMGMIHRDIKPANVQLDVHGQAILMDFGLVKIAGGARHTATGAVLGTAMYMSPEVIRGETADPRSDEYALGVTLFQMVGGRVPYDAKSAGSLLMMHLHDPIPDVGELRADVLPALSAIVSRTLAKDREERYASMEELAVALNGALQEAGSEEALHLQATQIETTPAIPRLVPAQPGVPAESAAVAAATALEAAGDLPPAKTPRAVPAQPGMPADRAGVAAPTALEAAGNLPPASARRAAPLQPRAEAGNAPPPQRPAAAPSRDPSRSRGGRSRWVWVGLSLAAVVLVGGLAAVLAWGLGRDEAPPDEPAVSEGGQAATPAGTAPAAAEPNPPTALPTPTSAPTVEAVVAPAVPISVTITGVSVDASQQYAVEYQVLGLPEVMTSTHLHFFFNNLPFEQAGAPAPHAWKTYFGPSPFTGMTTAERPSNASQVCAQAANPNHTPMPGTGSCAPLPDVVLAAAAKPLECLYGPGSGFPPVARLNAGERALVTGLSPDELWWSVVNPGAPDEECWLYTVDTQVSGDLSRVPIVEGPPEGEAPPHGVSVEIAGVSLNADGQYAADFVTQGFTPALPGTHIHFYFDTFTPQQVGIGGDANRLAYAGSPPFTGYAAADRPAGATQLCAIVANPDHSVVLESGTCTPLPDLPAADITGITLDAQGQYVVDFATQNVVLQYPGGTHLHYYFNTFSPDQVGIGGDANRRSYGGAPPFTGFGAADRPEGATELCVLVANPEHSVIAGSGDCYPLPGLPTAGITGITLDAQNQYVVDFATENAVLQYPGGTHLHFYFNTFTQDQVGIGGDANRRSHGGPSPFTGFGVADRPEGATEMCVVVANPDHTVISGSGNCYPLAGLPAAQITAVSLDAQGQYVAEFMTQNAVLQYPGGTHLHFYFNSFTQDQVGVGGEANRRSHGGPSPFTGFAAADRPEGASELCVVVANPDHTVILNSGNCYYLPDALAVEITGVTVNSRQRYVAEYSIFGFSPGYPGTHVHFFFDTVTPEDVVGGGAASKYYYGRPPFSGYSTASRPQGASRLCAIVALEDDTMLQGSGNCFPLPAVAGQ